MATDDLDAVLAINDLNTGDVGSIDAEQLSGILDDSRIALVAIAPEGELVGFCLVVDAGCRHHTPRSAWAFETAAPDLHLERVAFDMQYSGYGLGLALYDELDLRIEGFAAASPSGEITLTSLVRLEPPNEHAIGFHAKRGFETVDQASFGDVTVGVAAKTYTA
jgi:predicted GNAT superfamily acetyltransferase